MSCGRTGFDRKESMPASIFATSLREACLPLLHHAKIPTTLMRIRCDNVHTAEL